MMMHCNHQSQIRGKKWIPCRDPVWNPLSWDASFPVSSTVVEAKYHSPSRYEDLQGVERHFQGLSANKELSIPASTHDAILPRTLLLRYALRDRRSLTNARH